MKAKYLIKADGKVGQFPAKKELTLEEAQGLVGGYIELVRGTREDAIVNEEGRLMGLPVNLVASRRMLDKSRPIELVGDVIIIKKGSMK